MEPKREQVQYTRLVKCCVLLLDVTYLSKTYYEENCLIKLLVRHSALIKMNVYLLKDIK